MCTCLCFIIIGMQERQCFAICLVNCLFIKRSFVVSPRNKFARDFWDIFIDYDQLNLHILRLFHPASSIPRLRSRSQKCHFIITQGRATAKHDLLLAMLAYHANLDISFPDLPIKPCIRQYPIKMSGSKCQSALHC